MTTDVVRAAYRRCEEITWSQARNFSYGIRLLPPPKRQALAAVYAFARRIDDIGDGTLPAPEKLVLLEEARAALAVLPAGPQVLGHVLPVLGELQRGAHQVGEPFPVRCGGAEDVQHDPADRVGRQAAVTEQLGEGLVAGDPLVLAVRLDQVEERLGGDRVPRDGRRERPDHREPRALPAGPGRDNGPRPGGSLARPGRHIPQGHCNRRPRRSCAQRRQARKRRTQRRIRTSLRSSLAPFAPVRETAS